MNKIFIIVRDSLIKISELTGRSYNEINIIVYYYILPFFYLSIIDYKIETHILKIIFSILVLLIMLLVKDFKLFADSLFNKSVKFLKWFEVIGWNYIVSSVIICVFIPIIVLILILTLPLKP